MAALVSVEWLSAHLDDPDLVVLDCTNFAEFDAKTGRYKTTSGRKSWENDHITSSRFVDFTDGFSGNEHNFPVLELHQDVVQLIAQSQISYTPTLLVNFGGPFAENYFYTRENPHRDKKLRRFMPANAIASRTLRTQWFLAEEFVFPRVAAQAAKIIRAGGRVGVGAHGQLQGLGYHWEMSAVASGGLTPEEVLTAATRHGAEIIGVAQDIGTVAVGKLADLVILSKDPRADIRNTTALDYVVKNGEVFAADTLDKLWPDVQPLPPQWWWDSGPPQSR